MNNDCNMIYEAYGTMYRGDKTEQDSKDYSMNLTPFIHIIHKLAKGIFDTDSDQDMVSKGVLQGIFEVDMVDGHRQVVLTDTAVEQAEQMYPELKGKFWECGKCKADYASCTAAKHGHDEDEINVGKSDLDGDGKLSEYELARGGAIDKAMGGDGKLHDVSEDEERRLDPKCWKGYHKSGTKMKNGVRVNNCVKS